jgi:phosphate transport system permease protein
MASNSFQLDPPALRGLIARRKLVDFLFAMLGLALVAAALSVLVVLFGQLVRDGSARLASTHEVKPDGMAPGRRELVGELKRLDSPAGTQWLLVSGPLLIADPEVLEADLPNLQGETVILTADRPEPGATQVQATAIELADTPPEAFLRDRIYGTLEQRAGQWIILPAELSLDVSAVERDLAPLEGRRVTVDAGRGKALPLAVREVEVLVHQTFFNSMPSRTAHRAGIKSAVVGSVLVVLVTMLLALPLGVGAGVYLEEYGRKNWLTAIIEINIANLAGIPSIIWGLMALGLFVYGLGMGRSIQTAGMTLGLLVLPIVIMATREAIRSIPQSIREAAYACGASKWQTTRYHIIPYSMSGILTGTIIGLSRAIGETAPLITIGALTYIAFLPEFSLADPLGWLRSEFTVLPIQMFNWISRPDPRFHANAAAAGVVLLALTLSMNGLAIYLRYRLRKSIQW